MNYLTAIRQAIKALNSAYTDIQSGPKTDEALVLVKEADRNVHVAKQIIMSRNPNVRSEDLVYAEWRKYAEVANGTLGDLSPASLANRAMCDHLQRLLEDWSPYGHSLVWLDRRSVDPKGI